jgi:type II secretory pathway component GspD/PulD (secretin)
LQFRSVSISDALKQITQSTGIKIVTSKQLGNQVITRSYKNQTVERILRDIFRDMNFALVWSYGEKGVDSV